MFMGHPLPLSFPPRIIFRSFSLLLLLYIWVVLRPIYSPHKSFLLGDGALWIALLEAFLEGRSPHTGKHGIFPSSFFSSVSQREETHQLFLHIIYQNAMHCWLKHKPSSPDFREMELWITFQQCFNLQGSFDYKKKTTPFGHLSEEKPLPLN